MYTVASPGLDPDPNPIGTVHTPRYGPTGLGQGSIFMHRPQQHNSQQRLVTHFKPIINFGQKRL